MKMGFEFQRAFQSETRRLLWLIGIVFGTIILFQCIELPSGSSWSFVFSRSEPPNQNIDTFVSENATIKPVLIVNMSSPSTMNTSVDDRDDPFSREVPELIYPPENHTSKSNLSSIALPPLQIGNFTLALVEPPVESPSVALLPREPLNDTVLDRNSSGGPTISTEGSILPKNVSLLPSPSIPKPAVKINSELQQKEVLTLSDMHELLDQNHLSPSSTVPRWPTKADGALVKAKSLIETATPLNNGLYAPLYRNATMFQRSYELMEQTLKVYIYQEGDRRIFHRPPLEGIYASEGWFMKLLEGNRHFVTKRAREAHLFYLPFSSRQLEETLYIRNSHSHKNLIQHLKDYLDLISAKYPFWNRTDGADHFLVACHDWAPSETKRHMSSCIRALCNADVKEGFNFGKDVSLPETYVRKAKNPLRDVGGKAPSKRRTLAFYAGNMHGYLRPILLQHFGNNTDPDMQIFGKLPNSKGNQNYIDYMKSSKYCICPRGYEVNSPRVVEAIFYECVPVIISDNFIPPFFETLNWESFAVFVAEKDVPNLKNILSSIPQKTFFRMHMRVRKVQQHFLWHPKPVKYDLFHMILHSIWYNRVFQFRPK
ncbi:hypothetical protein RND81_03G149400 [Saponaria officinalis]|uniref:Exostosin GT47 domain-containing protein n=1 Tax=Saponaria officinalis TaxID=3572 RepID=A0AAW1M5X7_SAPOF